LPLLFLRGNKKDLETSQNLAIPLDSDRKAEEKRAGNVRLTPAVLMGARTTFSGSTVC
jgi:hypothetical protein